MTDDNKSKIEAILVQLSKADIHYTIAPLWNASTNSIAIIIPGVVLRDGRLEEE